MMNNRFYHVAVIAAVLIATTACVKLQAQLGFDANLHDVAWETTRSLLANAEEPLDEMNTILVSSIVNIDNLEQSSTFGRTFSGYISSWLSKHYYTVVEMKLRDAVYMQKRKGTFLLSRNIRDLSRTYNAEAVIVGTYSIGRNVCYLSLRLIRAEDNVVLSAVDETIPLGSETAHLLGMSVY